MEHIIEHTKNFVLKELGSDASGHDFHHIERVRRNAMAIHKEEKSGDPFVIEMAALLHDIPDEKLNESEEAGKNKLFLFLQSLNINEQDMMHIIEVIDSVSFKGGREIDLKSVEAKIVQDADRLDAIGAIGIARTFAYGGKKGQPMYDPEISVREKMSLEEYRSGKSSSIHHFYEKLLKLRNLMNTKAAKRMANQRHQFMEQFLEQFYREWDGDQS